MEGDMSAHFEIGNIVQEKESGRKGLIVPDFMSCCSSEEVPVVWEGSCGAFEGTSTRNLFDLGPERPLPDPKKCGVGKDGECCSFLALDKNVWSCQRAGELRYHILLAENMKARRQPTDIFPGCQLS
jgi:hypothetical protein